jgi:hypothetical protein
MSITSATIQLEEARDKRFHAIVFSFSFVVVMFLTGKLAASEVKGEPSSEDEGELSEVGGESSEVNGESSAAAGETGHRGSCCLACFLEGYSCSERFS